MTTNRTQRHSIGDELLAQLGEKYKRFSAHVDFARMLDTSIIHVGVGASSWGIEQMARLGIKRWVLFDPDVVEEKNLAVQNFTRSDLGSIKTEAMARRLAETEFEAALEQIPPLRVDTFRDFLEPSDDELTRLIETERANFAHVLLVMATDFHPAQARGAILALQHDIPVFFVGAYREAMAGELVFWHPAGGPSLPCYRCITASRYAAYEARRGGAAVSSGLPFGIGMLDAALAHLIVGAIHYEEEMPWQSNPNAQARLFGRLLNEKRNFIQMQLSPEYRLGGEDIFRDAEGIDGPNVVTWISLFQNDGKKADCPDCVSRLAQS